MAAAWWIILEENNERNENQERNFAVRIMRRILRDTQDPFNIPEKRFQELYR